MSRVAKKPIQVPQDVKCTIEGQSITFSKGNASLTRVVNDNVAFSYNDDVITFVPTEQTKQAIAQSGTERALVQNNLVGITEGYQVELQVYGVGYRAKLEGRTLVLTLGYSHPIHYEAREGVIVEVPSQTEIVVKGIDKQKVGQTVADIRAFKLPDPYKGKGIRLKGEVLILKEGKKK